MNPLMYYPMFAQMYQGMPTGNPYAPGYVPPKGSRVHSSFPGAAEINAAADDYEHTIYPPFTNPPGGTGEPPGGYFRRIPPPGQSNPPTGEPPGSYGRVPPPNMPPNQPPMTLWDSNPGTGVWPPDANGGGYTNWGPPNGGASGEPPGAYYNGGDYTNWMPPVMGNPLMNGGYPNGLGYGISPNMMQAMLAQYYPGFY